MNSTSASASASASASTSENTTITTTVVNTVVNDIVDEKEIDDQTHQSPSTIHSIPSPVAPTTSPSPVMNKSVSHVNGNTHTNTKITTTTSMTKKPIKKVVTTTTTTRNGSKSTVGQSVIKTRTQAGDKKNITKPTISKSVKTMTSSSSSSSTTTTINNNNNNNNNGNGITVSKTNGNVKNNISQGMKGREKKKLSQHLIRPKFVPSSRKVNSTTNPDRIGKREERELSRTMDQSTGKNRNEMKTNHSLFISSFICRNELFE